MSHGARGGVLERHKYLEPEQAKRLAGYLRNQLTTTQAEGRPRQARDAVLGLLLLGTGLRVSEACALERRDIVLDGPRRYVSVRCGKGRQARDVTIGAELHAILQPYLADRPEGVVLAARGRRLSRSQAWRIWKRALRAVGLDMRGRGVHSARHTRAVALYSQTKDLRLVQRELGHADPATTAIYADVLDSARAATADAADGWLKGTP
jgi:integrase/recombinase XerC